MKTLKLIRIYVDIGRTMAVADGREMVAAMTVLATFGEALASGSSVTAWTSIKIDLGRRSIVLGGRNTMPTRTITTGRGSAVTLRALRLSHRFTAVLITRAS